MCVFLMWLLVKRKFGASLRLSDGILVGRERITFCPRQYHRDLHHSALALVLFCLLVMDEKSSLPSLVGVGVVTFGITLTNFIQNSLAFIVSRPRWREVLRFAGWTMAVSLLLTYLHAYIYPAQQLFFLVPDVQNEDKFFLYFSSEGLDDFQGRILYLIRTLVFYSMIAPKVFILTEEVGSTIPEFRFYKISVGTFHQTDYVGMADPHHCLGVDACGLRSGLSLDTSRRAEGRVCPSRWS